MAESCVQNTVKMKHSLLKLLGLEDKAVTALTVSWEGKGPVQVDVKYYPTVALIRVAGDDQSSEESNAN